METGIPVPKTTTAADATPGSVEAVAGFAQETEAEIVELPFVRTWGGEAPFSINWKMRSAKGISVMFTARGADFAAAYAEMTAAFKRLVADGFVPQTADTRNKAHVEGKADTKSCPVHNVEMRLFTKEGRSWYSHQTNDPKYPVSTSGIRWCSGKPPKSA